MIYETDDFTAGRGPYVSAGDETTRPSSVQTHQCWSDLFPAIDLESVSNIIDLSLQLNV